MSEIRDKALEEIATKIYRTLTTRVTFILPEGTTLLRFSQQLADQILSIPEIAVVDRKAELPTKYGEGMSEIAKTGYKMAHAEINYECWIKEVKE